MRFGQIRTRRAAAIFVELFDAAMSEGDASTQKQKDPAELWGELDDTTRERVIEIFVGMAFRLVTNQADSKESKRTPSENPTER